jgi:hypothetical protein
VNWLGAQLNPKLAFVIGPIASPVLVLAATIAIGILSGLQDGISGLLQASAGFFLAAAAYSYAFSIIFGLPIYALFIKKGWTGYGKSILGAFLATGSAGAVMAILQQFDALKMSLLPMLFFASCNASLIWLLLRRPVNESKKAPASQAGMH